MFICLFIFRHGIFINVDAGSAAMNEAGENT